MIAWFAESFTEAPSQTHDAAHEELLALAKARISLVELRMRLQSQSEHAGPGPAQKAHVRVLKSLAGEVANLELWLGPGQHPMTKQIDARLAAPSWCWTCNEHAITWTNESGAVWHV